MSSLTTSNANAPVPAHLQGGKTSSFGNVTSDDLIIPRLKLLQANSPEVVDYAHMGAVTGVFWHTLAEVPLGDKVRIIPLILNKEIVLWAPRGDDRGILARSRDCIHWDGDYANKEFQVKIKGVKDPVTYRTMGNVAESGLADFGSAIPGDPDSRPAASLTYIMLFFLPDYPDISPVVIINTRSSVKPAKLLISKIELKPVDCYGQVYTMSTTDERGDEGMYKGYAYTSDGYATYDEYEAAKALYNKFKDMKWGTNDISSENSADPSASHGGATSDKF